MGPQAHATRRQGFPVPGDTHPNQGPSTPADAERALKQALGLPPNEPLDVPGVMELAAMLVELASSLDQISWSTWKVVAPSSPLKRTNPARVAMARFVSG